MLSSLVGGKMSLGRETRGGRDGRGRRGRGPHKDAPPAGGHERGGGGGGRPLAGEYKLVSRFRK